jgi:hypothetical protein
LQIPSKNNLSALKSSKKTNILPKPTKKKSSGQKKKEKGFYFTDDVREKFEQLLLFEKQKTGKKISRTYRRST